MPSVSVLARSGRLFNVVMANSGGMGGRAAGSSFCHRQKDLKSRLRAPHRDWIREARVPRARSEGPNPDLMSI